MIPATLHEIRPPPRILAARERPNTDISIAEEPSDAVSLCVFVRRAGTADVGAQQAVSTSWLSWNGAHVDMSA